MALGKPNKGSVFWQYFMTKSYSISIILDSLSTVTDYLMKNYDRVRPMDILSPWIGLAGCGWVWMASDGFELSKVVLLAS